MGINLVEAQSRLEALLAEQKRIESDIKAGKAMIEIGSDLTSAIANVFTAKNVDIVAMSGRFLSLAVIDGKLDVDIVSEMPKAGKANSGNSGKTTTSGKAGNYEYVLKDGRKFDRVVDAIEAMTGKPCEIKHDGKTFPDGKAILRYSRLTKDLKAAISRVDKPAATTAATTETK